MIHKVFEFEECLFAHLSIIFAMFYPSKIKLQSFDHKTKLLNVILLRHNYWEI